jgi:phosphate starvation-inducible PhoH-like protein
LRIVRDILDGVNDLEFMDLTQEDVVRHNLVGDIVAAYGRYDEANQVRQIKRGVDR